MPGIMHDYDVRTFLIYVDSYENNNPTGYCYNPGREEMGGFRSLTQLLMTIEESLDFENMPQAYTQMRTFEETTKVWMLDFHEKVNGIGKMASFEIRVLYRRNSSWQGTLTWLEKGLYQKFRSVWELISLIHSALEKV